MVIDEPRSTETLGLLAVNGPMVAGVVGTSMTNPDEGTGSGIGWSKERVCVGIVDGVAPWTARVALAFPTREVLPAAAAACTISAGVDTWAWKSSRSNCWPGDGAAGDSTP